MSRIGDGLRDAIKGGVIEAAQVLEGHIREVIFERFTGRPTGALARSFKTELTETRDGIGARVTSSLVYAGIQDEGGHIFPRTRQNLAVPIHAGKNLPIGTSPRDVPGLVPIKRIDGQVFLARIRRNRRGANSVEAFFALRKQVILEGKHYLAEAERRAEPEMREILGDAYETHVTRELDK